MGEHAARGDRSEVGGHTARGVKSEVGGHTARGVMLSGACQSTKTDQQRVVPRVATTSTSQYHREGYGTPG